MASTVPEIGPTLREGAGGTAGALAGGPVVARRKNKIVVKDTVKVSNNFGAMLQRRHPSRKGSGLGMLDSSSAALKADIIPSDEEISDIETNVAAKSGGHPSGVPPADKGRDFAAAAARQKRSKDKVNDNDNDDEDNDNGDDDDDADKDEEVDEGYYVDIPGFAAAPAAAAPDGARTRAQRRTDPSVGRRNTARGARAAMFPSNSRKMLPVPSRHTAHPEIKATADLPGLRFGMEALRNNMKLPGTAAYRFAATMGNFDKHDGWANDFGPFIAAIHDEDAALNLALSPGCEAQTYLCIDRNLSCFVVLHGLRHWTANPSSWSINSGRLVAWKGETIEYGGPPDLW
jgi:hypothetical protein